MSGLENLKHAVHLQDEIEDEALLGSPRGAGWNITVEGRWGVGAVGGRCLAWKQETRVLIPALLLSPTCFLGVPHGECEITSSVSVFSKHGSYIFYLNHCHFLLEVKEQFRP